MMTSTVTVLLLFCRFFNSEESELGLDKSARVAVHLNSAGRAAQLAARASTPFLRLELELGADEELLGTSRSLRRRRLESLMV